MSTATSPGATPPATVAPAARRESPLSRLLAVRELPVVVSLVALVAVTTAVNPLFLSGQGVKDLLLNATIVMMLAVGQAMIIITRNVDLSIGSMLGLCAFGTGTMFAGDSGVPIAVVFVAMVALGGLLGAVNGMLVTVARVPALVITLGTLYVFRGINNLWAGGTQYFADDRPRAFGALSVDTVLGIPIITLVAVAVVAAVAVVMSRLRAGRDLYAIGSDPDAAAVFGIPVLRRVMAAFIANGMLVGLAGVLYASRFNSVGATTGTELELTVVAAVVVGGVAIFGGSGTVVGAAVGAFLLTTITSSLTALRIDKFWQQAVVGALIIAAIAIERIASLRAARKLREQSEREVLDV